MNNDEDEKLKEQLLIKDLIIASGTEGIGISHNGIVLYVNDQIVKLLGYNSADEIIGEPVHKFVAPRSAKQVMENIEKGFTEPYESFSLRADGTEFPTLTVGYQTEFMGKKVRITAIRDITEIYNSRQELERSELRYRTLFNQLPMTIWDEDASELVAYAKEMGLYEIQDIETYLEHHPEIVSIALSKLSVRDVNNTALEMLQAPSKKLIIENLPEFFTKQSLETFRKPMAAIIKKEKSFQTESEFRRYDGKIIEIEVFWRVLPGYEEDYSRIMTIITDISEKKKTARQKRRMESRIDQMQKLESLGVFAAGIAEDFSKLINGIRENARNLLKSLDQNSPERVKIKEIESIASNAADLTQQLLAYSGRVEISKELFNLNVLIIGMKESLENILPERIALAYNLSNTEPWVDADQTLVRQLIVNLIHNAVENLVDEGSILIKTHHVIYEDLKIKVGQTIFQPTKASFYTCLEISDTGTGIDESLIGKIFDPFFSTKTYGSGLGLSVVQGIIQAHGAGLILQTSKNEGTNFKILFPQTSDYKKVKERI